MSALWQLSAREIAAKIRSRALAATDVAEAHIGRALALNDTLGAFLHFEPDDVRRQARALDRHVAMGHDAGPLAGVPVALKDNICARGMPTTCASRMLETFVSPYDAYVVTRLREAGALLFGKTNMDEFSMGSSTEYSAFRPSRNPYGLDRTPGGSSGGSAAAVAAGLVPLALGSDTGGSIRQPAAYCGIVGMKPTYGLVSRQGLIAHASSLDQIGAMARNVADARLLLSVLAGHDVHDATSSVRHLDERPQKKPTLRGVKVGVPAELFSGEMGEEVRAAVGAVRSVLARQGAEVEEVSLPLSEHALAAYCVISTAEASSNLARYDGVRYGLRIEGNGDHESDNTARTRGQGFGKEVKRRILLGTFALASGHHAEYYGRAQAVRAALRSEMEDAFTRHDVLLAPTAPTVAFKLGETDDPLTLYKNDRFTVPASLAGIPAVALPCGRRADGLPIGLQFMAARFSDDKLLSVAEACETSLETGHDWPPEAAR